MGIRMALKIKVSNSTSRIKWRHIAPKKTLYGDGEQWNHCESYATNMKDEHPCNCRQNVKNKPSALRKSPVTKLKRKPPPTAWILSKTRHNFISAHKFWARMNLWVTGPMTHLADKSMWWKRLNRCTWSTLTEDTPSSTVCNSFTASKLSFIL